MTGHQVEKSKRSTDADGKDVDAEDPDLPTPPDGGWGWVVVFASFMVHVIADGVAYSFGVYVESFTEYFACSKSEIGLLGSIMLGVTWGSGPIASMLVNKYGCRIVTILGTCIAAFGFIVSIPVSEFYRENIYFMYVTFGIIAGVGLGFAYLPAIVSVSYYFEKRRSFATGLAVCGSGVGTFIFAPLTELLLQEYGWKGTVLIESGLLLNCILCGAVMRPLEAPRKKRPMLPLDRCSRRLELGYGFRGAISSVSIELQKIENGEVAGFAASDGTAPLLANGQASNEVRATTHSTFDLFHPHTSLKDTPHFSHSEGALHHSGKSKTSQSKPVLRESAEISPMARKDVFYTRSLDKLQSYKDDPVAYRKSVTELPPPSYNDTVDNDTTDDGVKNIGCFPSFRRKFGRFSRVMDCSLLIDPIFMLFAISNLLTSIGFCIPYIYLPNRGEKMGFDSTDSAFLISIVGISNTIGRIVFGYIADFKCVNRLMLYNTVLVLCGLTSIASSLCINYGLMASYAFSFGLLIGVYTCLTPIVLVDLLGLEKLSNAFGLVLLHQGIGAVVGPPMAGGLYDRYENYDYSFYLMGVCLAVSGAMLYPIPCIKRSKTVNDSTEHPAPAAPSRTAVVRESADESVAQSLTRNV